MKIKYYPNQPHCFAFGGFEIQMLDALESVIKLGVEAEKIDVWSRDNDFDVLHVWGFDYQTFNVLRWAKLSGKIVIASVLLSYFDSVRMKLSYIKNYSYYRILKRKYAELDGLVVVNNIQAEIANKYFGVPPSKIVVIPNIIKKPFFSTPDISFSKKYRINDYILSVGNICKRKNQLKLAEIANKLDKKLVLIGNVLDGERDYAEKLANVVGKSNNIIWLKELSPGSDELVSAFYGCKLFALLSDNETQPITALEATALKRQVLMFDRAYAKQTYFSNAVLCKNNESSIAKAIVDIFKNPLTLDNYNIVNCTEDVVGIKFQELYEKLYLKKMNKL